MTRLQHKVAVVTGGTSGIGLATVQRFVAEGAFVYIFARRKDELDKTAALLGPNVATVAGDVRNIEDLDRLYAAVAADGRKLDIVVANVGAVDSVKLADVTIDSFNHNFEVNARGVLFTVQKSLPLLNHGASIILTGTIAALRGFPGRSAYAASKTALRSYARTWTMELKERGVRVNTITPGPCDTPLIDAQVSSKEEADLVRAKHAANIPLGRMARPEEIASAMLFLASDDSSFVAGSELLVDGGMCSV
ncbi:SDR family NAD(P)-dependent oxidoreductase [Paraburkholderia largidicola]|uniref:Oxidoreductase n=1 Tax=Paraburkholderia largidicola TaxID=3014751 RepID=A0A7I8C215_9BURK|nr:SDR family oxidoreductase [Paraburkholderia sp. PGU16]BCF95064.1 oxidoreductase [Paraburkholderia sp. PGU16]